MDGSRMGDNDMGLPEAEVAFEMTKGKIPTIDKANKEITLRHGEIGNPAVSNMTMSLLRQTAWLFRKSALSACFKPIRYAATTD